MKKDEKIHHLSMAILLLRNYRDTFKPSLNGYQECERQIRALEVILEDVKIEEDE